MVIVAAFGVVIFSKILFNDLKTSRLVAIIISG
ncbi:hypothetical protein DR79_1298 [Francisella tularensis]|nr:hypothetical protein DR79_1298 [Francisella tularensis]